MLLPVSNDEAVIGVGIVEIHHVCTRFSPEIRFTSINFQSTERKVDIGVIGGEEEHSLTQLMDIYVPSKKNPSQSSIQLKYSPEEEVEDSVHGVVNIHFYAFPWTFWNELLVSSLDFELLKDSLDCENLRWL